MNNSSNANIIVITGISGSGKSTLGKIIRYRYKDVHVVDTDNIDDSSFFELFDHNKEFRHMIETSNGDPFKIHADLNRTKRDLIIKDYTQLKTIVFVGMTMDFTDINHIGYFLDTTTDLNYKAVNKRTLNDICKINSTLSKMYDTENPHVLDLMILFKYKIRHSFPIHYNDVKNSLHRMRDEYSNRGYKIMTGQEILNDLSTYLQPLHNKFNKSKEEHIIVHISGVQGSGKSYMGDKLALYFGDLLYVKDLDELYSEFTTTDMTNYQAYIDDYIIKHKDKPIVFVGLDAAICLGPHDKLTEPSYNLHTKYKFFIDIEDQRVLEQRFFRQIQKLSDRKEEFIESWIKTPKETQEKLFRYVDISSWIENNELCKEFYLNKDYIMMSYDDVFDKIREIIM